MSVNGDVSEQVVRLSLEGFEVLARLTGSGAKNVAAMIYTIMKDKKQTKGKINLNNMIRTGKPLKIFTVSKDDLKTFAREAKNYGISYCALIHGKNKDIDGMVDVMVKDEDASRINRIVERFKLTTTDTAKLDTVITKAIEDRDAEKREKGIPEISGQNKRISNRTVQTIIKDELLALLDENPYKEKYHTHTLRHTGATLLYNEKDINIFVLKRILGHECLDATEIYTHISDKKLKYIMENCTISSILERNGGQR